VPVLRAPCFVFSDVHLGVTPPEVERSLLGFLEHVRGAAQSVIINGDLFDFWFEWRTVMPRAGFRVLASLARLTEAGIPVLWVAGNHDCWGGDILTRDVGVTYHLGAWTGDIAGWQTRLDHGDGLRDVEDRRYRVLRSVLRNRWSIRAFRWIHPDLGSRIALGSSHASRTYRARDGGEGLRRVAHDQLSRLTDVDLLIYGHSHVPLLERGSSGVYANAGTWMDDTTYLTIREDAVRLHRWSIDDPERELSSVPRPGSVTVTSGR
jgi:UDP-2,3-diacylglucosamine hydrolase